MVPGVRIVKEKRKGEAFTGEGARKAGGRWTSKGLPVVYASSSASLATLEILVHLEPGLLHSYCCIEFRIPDECIEALDPKRLPRNWRAYPAPSALQTLGDEWFHQQSSLALKVPSAITPGEFNVVLNTRHPDFRRLVIGSPQPFGLDPRLLAPRRGI